MADLILVPGAASGPEFWHLLAPRLEALGHRVTAVSLPRADESASLDDYAEAAERQWRERGPGPERTVVVAQSLGGFTAPVLAERIGACGVVLVNAMVPVPDETPGEWFATSGAGEAQAAFAAEEGRVPDPEGVADYVHDVPPDVLAAATPDGEPEQAGGVLGTPSRFTAWPARVLVVAGRDDRVFPARFQTDTARERLGVGATVLPGGHLVALVSPDALAAAIDAFAREGESGDR